MCTMYIIRDGVSSCNECVGALECGMGNFREKEKRVHRKKIRATLRY